MEDLFGVAVALWWAAKKLHVNIWALADIVVIPVALGLALGRVGNYINQELYWGIGLW
jgi:phosphatidylglycerol:prolipoprotein diacylglycerol transferase